MKIIKIPDNQIPGLINHYKERLQQINKERDEILDIIESISEEESSSKSPVINPDLSEATVNPPEIDNHTSTLYTYELDESAEEEVVDPEYNVDWNWTQKIEYAIKARQVALKLGEIVSVISSEDPNIHSGDVKASRSISATLSRKIADGRIFEKVASSSRETYYGLKEWFTDGRIDENRIPKQ